MKRIFLIGIALLALLSCSKTPTDNNNELEHFIVPLAIANYWHYNASVTYIYCDGAHLQCEFDNTITENTNTVLDTFSFGRGTAYVLEDDSGFQYVNENTASGFFQHGRLNSSGEFSSDEKLIAKYPISIGDIWEDSNGFSSITYECISQNEEVTVPAGTFSCHVYQLLDDDFTNGEFHKFYYAEDIGLIKEWHYQESYFYLDEYYTIPVEYRNRILKELDEYSLAERIYFLLN